MNNEGGLVPTNLAEVMDKFNQSIRKFAIKETEWLVHKGNYEAKISELEGQLKAHENINVDLLKRIKMLEYALNQERLKNSKLHEGKGLNEAEKDELKFNNNIILNDIEDKRQLLKEEDLKAMREKSVRPSLLAMLNDIGINENLANNLFADLELNKTELEKLIKMNMDEKLNQILTNNEVAKENPSSPTINNNKISNNPPQPISLVDINTNLQEQTDSLNKESMSMNQMNEKAEQTKNSNVNYNFSLSKYTELKSHFDVIRKLGYLPNSNALISVSEDCLIKIWSLNNINYSNQSSDIEPYMILRGHTGPLFSLAVAPDNSNLIYTAGNEGIIKIWKIPKQEEVNQYGDTETIFNCNVGFFQKPNEVVWEMKHHPKQKLLVSLSADASICIWETATAEEYIQALSEMKYDKWFKASKSRVPLDGLTESPIPTSCSFMNTDPNLLVCGFNDSYLSLYDFNKNTFFSHIKTLKSDKNDKHHNLVDYQPNCLVCSSSVPIVYGGFEDNTIKSIDMRIESVTNSITGHTDSVTSLNLFNDIYLFSTSHDTKVKMWDIRYLNTPLQEAIGSQKKWDEAMWHSILIPNQLVLATAGADSSIKLFKL